MIDDLRHLPRDGFQIVPQQLAGLAIGIGTFLVFALGIIPDIVRHFSQVCQ